MFDASAFGAHGGGINDDGPALAAAFAFASQSACCLLAYQTPRYMPRRIYARYRLLRWQLAQRPGAIIADCRSSG